MRLLPRGPVAVTSLSWRSSREPMRTVIARVTYELRPARCEVALRPEPVRTDDRWVDGGRGLQWLREASDLAPVKESADVVLVGRAHAPGPAPVGEVAIRLVAGEIDKTLRVTGARRWGGDGAPLPPTPFRDAPIDWTHAAGGPDTWNPVGVGDEPGDLRGESPAPTVLAFGSELERRGAYVAPAGLGPIPPTWAPRRDSLPGDAAAWLEPGAASASPAWNDAVRPSFFQIAPPDQRLPRPLRADERLVLEGLHPAHGRLVTNLPGVPLHALVVDAAGGQHPIALQGDTMHVDVERGLVVVTHRAALPARLLDGRDVFVWLEGFDAHVAQDIADASGQTADAASARREASTATPFDATGSGDDDEFERMAMGTIASVDGPAVSAMPFARAGGAPPPPPPPPLAPPVAGASPVSRTAPAAEPIAAPPLVPPPAAGSSPGWSGAWPAAPPMASSAPIPVAVAAPPIVAPPPVVPAPSVERIDTWKLHEQAAARRPAGEPGPVEPRPSVAPAAAEPAVAEAAGAGTRAVPIETVWLEPPSEIERAARSATLRAQLGEEDDDWITPGEAGAGAEDRARRDVARWLRAVPLPLDRLPETLTRALERDASERAYVVVAGELTWSFDAREAIRAWIALGTPLAAEPRVKSAIDAAEASLAENLVPIPDVLAASLDRLKDAVRAVAKMVGPTPIETAAERFLIEERGFGRRRVWGQSRLRAHLQARGARAALPVYLPESAGWEAPLAQKIAVRLVGELRTRQDPLEPMAVCLRGVALGIELDGKAHPATP